MSGEAARRFYAEAMVAPRAGGFTVMLDAFPLRTPARAAFIVPTQALAALCAAEWAAQDGAIVPASMPATTLANVAIDRTPGARAALVETVAAYAETDLLCHRAAAPQRLAARQAAAWDPLLAWAGQALGAHLTVTAGVIAVPQPPEARAAFAATAQACEDFALTALAHAAGLTGSGVIAFALARGRITGAEAFAACALDELFQIEAWGADEVLTQRLSRLQADLTAAERFFQALGAAV